MRPRVLGCSEWCHCHSGCLLFLRRTRELRDSSLAGPTTETILQFTQGNNNFQFLQGKQPRPNLQRGGGTECKWTYRLGKNQQGPHKGYLLSWYLWPIFRTASCMSHARFIFSEPERGVKAKWLSCRSWMIPGTGTWCPNGGLLARLEGPIFCALGPVTHTSGHCPY